MRNETFFALVLIAFAFCGSAIWITSEMTKPKITDPIAQRIWVATHGNISLNGKEAATLIKEATYADSVTHK